MIRLNVIRRDVRLVNDAGLPSPEGSELVEAVNAIRARTGGPLDFYAVANLPLAASSKSVRTFVSDATATTFASVVAGGGSNFVPVYCDGTNWRIG